MDIKKIFKIIAILAVIAVALYSMFSPTNEITITPSEDYYVSDYADLFTPATERAIHNLNAILEHNRNGAQALFVTIDSLDGFDMIQYELHVAFEWDAGNDEEDNGMVFIFAAEERDVGISLGNGIQDSFNISGPNEGTVSYRLGRAFDNDNLNAEIQSVIAEIIDWSADNRITSKPTTNSNSNTTPNNNSTDYPPNLPPELKDEYQEAIRELQKQNTPKPHRWYKSIPFIFIGCILLCAFFIILSALCSKAADKLRYFNAYYRKIGGPRPKFRIKDLWSGPHLDLKLYEIDLDDTCYLDTLAKVFMFLARIPLMFIGGGGGSSGSHSSGSGSGGGGRSGGGGGGRR